MRARALLARNPSVAACVPALGVLVWWATSFGGFESTTWYPGGLVLLALLVVALVAAPRRGRPPVAVRLACLLLAGYAAWSYLSITWASAQGQAWDGANRTALYAVVFALFALWRLRAGAAALLVGGFGVAVALVGLAELLAVHARSPDFIDGRLAAPVGYSNANVALWTMGTLACIGIGSRRELAPPLRALLLAGAGLLAGLSLLGQSRGWLYALPVALAVYLGVSRDRVRLAFTIVAVVVAGLAFRAPVLRVYTAFAHQGRAPSALADGRRAILLAALALGLAALAVGYAERRVRVPALVARRADRGFPVAVGLAVALAAILLVAGAGHPVRRLRSAWEDFKQGPQPSGLSVRFGQSLGSQRYDFWRVAWKDFRSHPIAGIGADNFQESYLRLRHSDEEPLYPHSVEFRTLSQTGIVGALLLLGAFGCALTAAAGGIRRRSGVGSAAASAAVAMFAYWILHGSVDWLWEFPVLGATGFAMLGGAAALAPPRAGGRVRPLVRSRPAIVVAGAAAAVVALSFASPYLAARRVEDASTTWVRDPARALSTLATAASINPLGTDAQLVRATIEVRLGLLAAAARDFDAALRRDPHDEYATLQAGAIASARRRPEQARALLERTVALDPRDPLVRSVLHQVVSGVRVDAIAVDRDLARRAENKLR